MFGPLCGALREFVLVSVAVDMSRIAVLGARSAPRRHCNQPRALPFSHRVHRISRAEPVAGYSFVKTTMLIAGLLVAVARPSPAQIVTIDKGTFVYPADRAGQLNISGNENFRLEARTLTGRFDAIDSCQVPECPPGSTVELGARWVGNDLPGTARLRGKTYPDVGGLSSPNSADVRFSGEVTMPAMSNNPVSITAPFDFAGVFFFAADLSQPQQDVLLTGRGLVTLFLDPNVAENSWVIRSATFDFSPARRR